MEARDPRRSVETSTPPDRRLTAFGNQLINVHLWLRQELTLLRDDVDAYLDGRGERPGDLRVHCLTFCAAVTRHHTGEDDHAFAHLAERFPELRPVLAELRREIVAGIMRDLQDLLGGLRVDPDPAERHRVRAELDGLAALLESHFGYEERRLVSALNTLEAPEWAAAPPDFLLTTPGDPHGSAGDLTR
jgi:hypothetical protein